MALSSAPFQPTGRGRPFQYFGWGRKSAGSPRCLNSRSSSTTSTITDIAVITPAQDDIRESIAELSFYRKTIFK